MDDAVLLLLALGLVLVIPALAIAGFVMALGARDRLRALEVETAQLRQQISLLSTGQTQPGPSDTPVSASDDATPRPEVAPTQEPVAAPPPRLSPLPVPPPPLPAEAMAQAAPEPPSDAPQYQPLDAAGNRSSGFEESIGKRWTVWVGGLALALGGIFLVQYSIEEGLFTPALQLILAALFSGVLFAGGEYLRRKAASDASPTDGRAPIPAILTAAGSTAAFATIYAAVGIYHFIDGSAAALLLGAVAVGTMLAALLHGPWIASLGIFGAYAAPLLIATTAPDVLALVLYLLGVTLAAFGVARLRLWRIVALWAIALALVWGFSIALSVAAHAGALPLALYITGLLALVAVFFVLGLDEHPAPPRDLAGNWPALVGIIGLAPLTFLLLQTDQYRSSGLAVAALFVCVALGLAARYPAMVIGGAIAGLFTVLALLGWTINVPATLDTGVMVQTFDGIVRIRPNLITEFALWAAIAAAVFLGIGGYAARWATPEADRTSGWHAGTAAFTPMLILIVAWLRIDGWAPSPLFAGLGLALALMLGVATRALIGRESAERPALSVAIAATGTIAALGAAASIALEKGALTIALALVVPAIAWVNSARPLPVLRPLSVAVTAIVLARVAWDPRIVGDDLGTTPVLNWLLYGYGVPTLAFGYAAWSFRRQLGEAARRDLWVGALEAATILFAGLLLLTELHHAMHGGHIEERSANLVELSLMGTMGLIGMIALTRIARRTQSIVQQAGGIFLLALSVAILGLGSLTGENPAFTDASVGTGLIFNDLLLGYLLPALVAGLAATAMRQAAKPQFSANVLAVLAIALSFTYVTTMTRHVYQGDYIGVFGAYLAILPHTTDAEIWAYSAVWLVYGIVALSIGGLAQSPFARMIAAAIIVLTVAKAFLYDMSALTGVFRAFSFIGLGAVLIGIGWVYQKYLFKRPSPAPTVGSE